MTVPDHSPRPPDERDKLRAVWRAPRGWRFISAVNNNHIGVWYIGTGLLFFLLAGILALMMRAQLAVPDNDLLSQNLYNQVFTMHGTIMMFLFAVPVVEAVAVFLLPNMLSARDLPFPRLGAFAFWAYAVGGIIFFLSLFFDLAPDGGWFMYPPLASFEFSPGINNDFWLLGIGFIEISAIAGAIEILVGVLLTRAPGMTLAKLPIYAWAMLVFAAIVIFAFPVLIVGTLLLELERSFHWPFFIADKGGDPLLWQHLFWFFGHPEVYIIFLPAAGMVSMIVPTMAQHPLIGYRIVVLSLVATAFFSFGLWVHHMFTTGIPNLSLSFFSAASMAVAIPSGLQVFAWIATFAAGRLKVTVPSLFVLGFLFIFVLGGLSGVMVAMVPFNWQIHDSYFVVAHFHYVLVGGMVFPLFAAIYYWMPMASHHALSERLGRWFFWLFFVGFNLTFFPMHITGLLGMPRRIHSYPAGMGWEWLNMLSTIGAFVIAAGILVFLFDLLRKFRPYQQPNRGNIWGAGSLEWLPSEDYATRSIPRVQDLYPLWRDSDLADDVDKGRYYLPGTATGNRETIVTSPVNARPLYVLRMPGPSWLSLFAAVFTAAFFMLLTGKLVTLAAIAGVAAVIFMLLWAWDTDWPPLGPVRVGGGLELPTYMTGAMSHSRWAMVILLIVLGVMAATLVFSYLFLWTVSPDIWPARGTEVVPAGTRLAAILLYLIAMALVMAAGRMLPRAARPGRALSLVGIAVGIAALVAAWLVEFRGYLASGLGPVDDAHGAILYAAISFQGLLVMTGLIMGGYLLLRLLAGKLDAQRRVAFDNTALFWYFTGATGIGLAAFFHLFPWLAG